MQAFLEMSIIFLVKLWWQLFS